MQERIESILAVADLSGFTKLLSGWPLKRYVVAFTHNVNVSSELLTYQYWYYVQFYDPITLWWRVNSQANESEIDIGTSTDNLNEAKALQKQYSQKCIRDSREKIEIR